LTPTRSSTFERAIAYPYRIPAKSYIYHDGASDELAAGSAFPDVGRLTPVLAVGSNQSPEQLARKFPGADWAPIPVARVTIANFDTVYSAHITTYGSIAATLHHAPGTTVTLFVNWLDHDQLARMHETELPNENYEFGCLNDLQIKAEVGPSLDQVYLYHGQRGIFAPDDNSISLTEVPASGRTGQHMTQHEIQGHLRDRMAPEKSLEDFINDSVSDPAIRQSRTADMAQDRLVFSYPGYVPSAL